MIKKDPDAAIPNKNKNTTDKNISITNFL